MMPRSLLSPFRLSNTAVVRAVSAITAPVSGAVGAITPRMVPPPLLLLGALAWLYAVRVVLRRRVAATACDWVERRGSLCGRRLAAPSGPGRRGAAGDLEWLSYSPIYDSGRSDPLPVR